MAQNGLVDTEARSGRSYRTRSPTASRFRKRQYRQPPIEPLPMATNPLPSSRRGGTNRANSFERLDRIIETGDESSSVDSENSSDTSDSSYSIPDCADDSQAIPQGIPSGSRTAEENEYPVDASSWEQFTKSYGELLISHGPFKESSWKGTLFGQLYQRIRKITAKFYASAYNGSRYDAKIMARPLILYHRVSIYVPDFILYQGRN